MRGENWREATMHNLELKVRCPDEATLDALIATAVADGADYARTLAQRDTYFVVPHGRLKLREWHQSAPAGAVAGAEGDVEAAADGATLIAYARPDDSGSRLSDYLLSAVPEPEILRASLARALGIRVVVEKERKLYFWGQTRIHFDHVAGLGAFIELETLLDNFPAPAEAAAAREHQTVIDALGLAAFPTIAGSYSDLLAHTATP